MDHRLRTPEGAARYKRRGATVEPAIGNLKKIISRFNGRAPHTPPHSIPAEIPRQPLQDPERGQTPRSAGEEPSWRAPGPYGRLADVLATVSFYYGHRDPVSVTAG